MSEDPNAPPPSAASPHRGRDQRSAKNYLIDRRFQLKYTALLVGIALLLSAALGFILWSTSNKVIQQSQQAVEQGKLTVLQGQETVRRGQQVIEASRNLSKVVGMTVASAENPELAKTFEEDTADDERKLKEEQTKFERDAEALKKWSAQLEEQAKAVEQQQRSIGMGLLVLLSLLVICVGLAGIVFTHKVAGPIYKMKRLLRQVGEGKLVVRERLRRGDELHDFFETFEKMVEDLRNRKEKEIAKLDAIVGKLESDAHAGASEKGSGGEGVTMLKGLRAQMRDHIDG